MSVSVYYHEVNYEKLTSKQLSDLIPLWIAQLPEEKQLKITKLHNTKDQFLSLAGLILLKQNQGGRTFDIESNSDDFLSPPCVYLPTRRFNICLISS